MSQERKYLIFGIPLLTIGGILLALSLPILVTTPRPPPFSYMASAEDYDLAFYRVVIGAFISCIGLIFVGIHKAGMAEENQTRTPPK